MSSASFAPPPGSRAILYLRVSTGRQAQNDLSIPDQRKQLRTYCKNHACIVVGEYKDARSGRDDKRPGFQAMMDDILFGGLECEIIVVHSFSRFFRDEIVAELHIRSLAKRGVRLVSKTQPNDGSPEAEIARRLFAIMDEYSSLQTARHVTRTLHENALQGHWNGGVTPFGYRVVGTERRGKTIKKGLAIDEEEARVVQRMFDLALRGDGSGGPMGIKAIVNWLNDRGYRTRLGNRWGISAVHRRLRDRTYTGTFVFHSKENGGVDIPISVPALIDEETFETVGKFLEDRNPKKTPPRVTTGEVLLTGLLTCPHCGQGMTTQTGKSGQYRYYACSRRMRVGEEGCRGRRVPMETLDAAVLGSLRQEMFTIDVVDRILAPLLDREKHDARVHGARLAEREKEYLSAKQRHDRLYRMIESGLVDMGEPDFKERFLASKDALQQARRERDQVAAELSPEHRISREKILSFVDAMNEALENPSPGAQRGYLRAIIDEIEVGETVIRIRGRRTELRKAIARQALVPSPVPSFVRKWRRERDWRRTFSDL